MKEIAGGFITLLALVVLATLIAAFFATLDASANRAQWVELLKVIVSWQVVAATFGAFITAVFKNELAKRIRGEG